MTNCVIQDWTDTQVPLRLGTRRDVRYKVYREGAKLFQEIRDTDDAPIHTLELPPGMVMDKSSYEVLIRFVLTDVVQAA